MKNRIFEYFKDNASAVEDEILSLLGRFIQEKTINLISEQISAYPFLKFRGEEYRVGDIVRERLDQSGLAYDVHSRMEGRPNIIARLGQNTSGKRLLAASHMDIVPPGDGWATDPFVMTRKGGFVFGRGVLDNKGPLAASIVALEIMKKLGLDKELPGEFQVAALSDEEAHDSDGIDYGIGFLMEDGKINATMAIIPDIGENMQRIDVAEKGPTVFKVTAIGKQAHGSTPERGVNAVYAMGRLIPLIENLALRHSVHPVLGGPSHNLGQIQGGVAPNVVPGECSIIIDIRSVPGMTPESIAEDLEACCAKAAGEFRVEKLAAALPHGMDPEHELVRSIQENCQSVMGFVPETFGMGGATFAKTLNIKGIPAVGWGPGDDNAFHMVDESVEVAQLVDFCKMLCLVSVDLLS